MDRLRFFFNSIFLFTIFCVSVEAQSYQAPNKISLVIRETKSNTSRLYVSHGLSVKADMERNEFTFQVAVKSFLQVDSSQQIKLDSILPDMDYPMISFKGALPFNKLDKDVGTKQTLTVQGVFYIGNQMFTTYLPVEFEFMDKQLLFDTYFILDLNKFNITLPRDFQDKFSSFFDFRIDNGHLLTRQQ